MVGKQLFFIFFLCSPYFTLHALLESRYNTNILLVFARYVPRMKPSIDIMNPLQPCEFFLFPLEKESHKLGQAFSFSSLEINVRGYVHCKETFRFWTCFFIS